jgi:hypothetical protein
MGPWGKSSPELQEHDGVVDGGGEVTAVEKSTKFDRGSGELSVKIASIAEVLGLDCLRGKMKELAAVLLDTAARLGDDGGYVFSSACSTAVFGRR